MRIIFTMNFQTDNNSTLSQSRRHPALLLPPNHPPKLKTPARPSIEFLHLRATKNISSNSFHSQHPKRSLQRVFSKERSPKISVECSDGPALIYSSAEEMNNELVKILREQNENLKGQNNFLVGKIREMHAKEKSLKGTIREYEMEVKELKEENQGLRREVADLTEDAKKKVEEFGKKLSILFQERYSVDSAQNSPSQPQQHSHPRSNLPSEPNLQTYVTQIQDLNQYLSTNSNLSSKRQATTPTKSSTPQSQNLLQDLNNQFEALIYSCRVEKNAEKRKEIRKRLVDLTYQMKALGGHNK